MDLDKTDRGILTILLKNSRASFRDMAAELGVSVPTISSKVGRLENLGLIQGYRVDLNLDMLSNRQVFFFVKTIPADQNKVAKKITKIPQCVELHILTGANLLARCLFDGPAEEMKVVEDISKIKEITDYTMYVTMSTTTNPPEALISERSSVIIDCYYCKKPMHDEPVKVKLDGKLHYLCCNTCKKAYVVKYNTLKAKAGL